MLTSQQLRQPKLVMLALAAASILLPFGRAHADGATPVRPTASANAGLDVGTDISFPNAVRKVCRNANFVLAGDMRHTSNAMHEAFANPDFAKMLKECGFTKVMVEVPTSFQPYISSYQNGSTSLADFESAQNREHGNIYHMSESDYQRKLTLERVLIDRLREQNIPLLAIDNGHAAREMLDYIMTTDFGFDLMRSKLDSEAQKYFDLTQAKQPVNMTKEQIANMEKKLDAAYNDPDVQKIFAEADKYAPALKERVDDADLAKEIVEKTAPEDKIFVIYGAGHMSSSEGLYALLKRQYNVVRFDMAPEDPTYKSGDIRPDFIYRLDQQRLYNGSVLPAVSLQHSAPAP